MLAAAIRHALGTIDAEILAGRIFAALSVDVRDELARLSRPLLCLQAARDRLVPRSCTAKIRALKPSAEFATVDGPHLLLQANPGGSWRRIESARYYSHAMTTTAPAAGTLSPTNRSDRLSASGQAATSSGLPIFWSGVSAT
jgi:hypothetical protein